MPNTIFSSEGALLFIMVATVALGFWLQRFKVFKTLGPALTVIVMGIVMSNLRIVPTSSATYDAISGYCVPLSVSICLLSLDLKQMRKLSKEPRSLRWPRPYSASAWQLWCSAYCSPTKSTRAGRWPVCSWAPTPAAVPT